MNIQERKKFIFEITGSSSKPGVVEIVVEETVSAPFHAELVLASPDEINIDDVIGKEALLTIKGDNDDRLLHGVLISFSFIGKKGRFMLYKAELAPQLWLLSQEQDCRIYQKKSVKDIVTQILQDANITNNRYAFRFAENYETKEYCVQYQETDLTFISRILEQEGIWYFFEHSKDKHLVAFADGTVAYKPLPGGNTISYKQAAGGMVPKEESIYQFTWTQKVLPGKVTQTDFNYLRPSLPLEAKEVGKTNRNLEIYEFPGGYGDQQIGQRLTKVRLQEQTALKDSGIGSSTCPRLTAGYTFTLKNHSTTYNKEYFITSVKHIGKQPQTLEEEAGKEPMTYANEFTVIPSTVPIRPERKTPWPTIIGPQTAIVTGPENHDIYTDEHARVKIKFPWDREKQQNKEQSSCWVRVSQLWAGNSYGSMFIPRVGEEVIVDFINGDIDQPIVTGRVYNGGTLTPYKLPDHLTKSTIMTTSSRGKGSNELTFEDNAGQEQIYLHAQKDLNVIALNNKDQTIGADDTKKIAGNQSTTVGGNQTETVTGSRADTVALASAETIGLAKALSIGGAYQESVGAAMNETVAAAKAEQVGAIKSVYVDGDMNENVGGNRRERITRHYTYTMDELHIRIDKNYNIKAMNTNTEIAGSAFFRAGKKFIEAEEIEFRAGKARLTLKNQLITIEGNNISMKSMGDVKLKGKNIYKEEAEGEKSSFCSEQYQFLDETDNEPVKGVLYCIEAPDGKCHIGKTNEQGNTRRIYTENSQEVQVRWGREAAAYLRERNISF